MIKAIARTGAADRSRLGVSMRATTRFARPPFAMRKRLLPPPEPIVGPKAQAGVFRSTAVLGSAGCRVCMGGARRATTNPGPRGRSRRQRPGGSLGVERQAVGRLRKWVRPVPSLGPIAVHAAAADPIGTRTGAQGTVCFLGACGASTATLNMG